jgi:hypothetical protein
MPVTVERLPEQPIIVAKFSGHIIADDVREVFTRSLTMITPEDKLIYRVSSLEEADSSFVDAFQSVQAGATEQPGTTKDSRFRVILVGRSRWTQMFVQFMAQKQFGGVVIPCFPTMDKALEYIEAEIARSEVV